MENVILIIHLILSVGLIGVVLLQRSEGGGMGLGGGGGGAVTGRQAATAMTKVTWVLAIAFLCTSVSLTVIAARNAAGGSVVDLLPPDSATEEVLPSLPSGESLIPPTSDDAPVAPPRSE
ncbi:preprotein translocase subunit SecG [Jannaschia pohangensis]|uniref:Protein-export membrane protein SecG n=1 Tax=Jannaschia pohangensis TaxID=390807 RepID=A0A1I3N6W8_9RHOB|nr:preprotein translocase subunit SecG [Jannaschia pohangensis]SFJ05028.1 preprotein translocase subunit SecG [Jannaschia pohangensis]